MTKPYMSLTKQLPTDYTELVSAVKTTINEMIQDGSTYVTPKDICSYNNWEYSLSSASRIGRVFRINCRMHKVTRKAFLLPGVTA